MSSWKIYPDTGFYFVTSSIVKWIPIFIDQDYFSIVTESLTYCREEKGLRIHAYVIMPNHIHLLVSSQNNISDIFCDFKSFTSKEITGLLKQKKRSTFLNIFQSAAKNEKNNNDYKVWQSGFHPIGIYSESFYKQKRHYIHHNPVKKGFVAKPEHWFYSSARNYVGLLSYPMEIDPL